MADRQRPVARAARRSTEAAASRSEPGRRVKTERVTPVAAKERIVGGSAGTWKTVTRNGARPAAAARRWRSMTRAAVLGSASGPHPSP